MATAKVIIAGQNNIGPAVKSAQGDITSLSNVAQKAGDTLKKAFTITAIVASLKKLGDACVSCFNDFWEAERKYKQLQIALGDTKAYVKVTDTINNERIFRLPPAIVGKMKPPCWICSNKRGSIQKPWWLVFLSGV